jgi:hypothetical protein
MDCQMQLDDLPMNNIGMGLRWCPGVYADSLASSQPSVSFTVAGMKPTSGALDNSFRWVFRALELFESVGLKPPCRSFNYDLSTFAHLEPFTQDYILSASIVDPAIAWHNPIGTRSNAGQLSPNQISSQASIPSHGCEETNPHTAERPISTQSSTPRSAATDSAVSLPPGESEKTRRARYAANQRHSKALQARKDSHQNGDKDSIRVDERKQRHREKNKVAAAKCRSRQRKQVQTIQEKGSRLGEENAKLKTIIQELRGELNALRSRALDHQACTCHVAQYNFNQAERIIAEYNSSHM